MKFHVLLTLMTAFVVNAALTCHAEDALKSEIQREDKHVDADGFSPIFNGADLGGWKTTGNWVVENDGVLSLKPKRQPFRLIPDIKLFCWYKEMLDDFVLKLEYKIEAGGRSGVFVRSKSLAQYLEVQIADASKSPDQPPTRVDAGSLVDVCLPSHHAALPAGQWNEMTIRCEKNRIRVDLNGTLVIDHDLASDDSTASINEGYLALQNQGDEVHFRNLRLKALKPELQR